MLEPAMEPLICTCDWAPLCGGDGFVECRARPYGCFCACGCQDECYGCADCAENDEDTWDDYETELAP